MGVAPFCMELLLRMSFFVMGTVPDPQVHYSTAQYNCQGVYEKAPCRVLFHRLLRTDMFLIDLINHDILKIVQHKNIFFASKKIFPIICTNSFSAQIGGFYGRVSLHAVLFTYIVEV